MDVEATHIAFAQFLELWKANQETTVHDWTWQTEWPWLSEFDTDEIQEFEVDMSDALETYYATGDSSLLEGTLHSWKSTAAVCADPEQLQALLAADDD